MRQLRDHRSSASALLVLRGRATVFGHRLPANGHQRRPSFSQIDNWCKKPMQTQRILRATAVELEMQKFKKIEP